MNLVHKNFHEGNMYFENGILYVKYKPQTIINENLLYKQFMYRKSLTKEQDIFMIVDLTSDVNVTDEAIHFVASHPCPEQIKALALITKSRADYIRARLFSIFDEPNVKTRVFYSEEEAILWFKSLEGDNFIGKAC